MMPIITIIVIISTIIIMIKPIKSDSRAFKSFRHCCPDFVSGIKCSSAPGNLARKEMPKTSAAI